MAMLEEDFVGREKEIKFIREWLAAASAARIVYFHDGIEEKESKGGIGKTWLLSKIFKEMEQQSNIIPVKIDFLNVADRDGVVIAERVVADIKTHYPEWSAQKFEPLLQIYRSGERGEKVEMANLREQLADALESDLSSLRAQLVKDNVFLLLIFDTYELIESNPITAVLRPSQPFPDMYQSDRVRVIFAGRNDLDWQHQNWVGRERGIEPQALSPFSYEEAEQYLKSRLYSLDTYTHFLKKIYEKTQGRPILLGLVADVLNHTEVDLEALFVDGTVKFEESLVWQINQFGSQIYWLILIMAHIHHHFNESLIERFKKMPEFQNNVSLASPAELLKELLELSFVRGSGSAESFLMLHDEMRRLVYKHCWSAQDPEKRMRRELSLLAQNYYSELIEKEKNIELRQGYIVEKLFHDLFLNAQTGFQTFQEHFNDAISRSIRTFARALLQELKKFERELNTEQKRTLKMAEAQVLLEEGKPADALVILASLEKEFEWTEQDLLGLLEEKAVCYLRQSDYPESIRCFQACLDIAEQLNNTRMQARFLNRLGLIHRRQGKYDQAMQFYDTALLLQRGLDDQAEYANILNNKGYVLRLQAKLEDALRFCKFALRIRRDLFREGQISEYFVGLSLSTLGHIYHSTGELNEEEKAYNEAFLIFQRIGNKSVVASTYNRLGRVRVSKGELPKAREDFLQAARTAIGFSREAEIESLNQLGRLDLIGEDWNSAADRFQKALTFARQVGQNFELAENLLYLAEALDYLKDPSDERISELLLEAKRISRNNNYTVLLALAGRIQGGIYLRKKEYLTAFRYYRVNCRYMAERGGLEYNYALRLLHDLLLEIPSNFLPAIIDSLLSYWNELGFSKKYPELPEICREVGMHMLL